MVMNQDATQELNEPDLKNKEKEENELSNSNIRELKRPGSLNSSCHKKIKLEDNKSKKIITQYN